MLKDLWFEADQIKLIEILTNLIDNAFKFTKEGQIDVDLKLKGEFLKFSVKDTGIGIDPIYHQHIFERFRQIEANDHRQYGGSGLGLSIAKAYVEEMGGTIWLKSALNQGSEFYFTIPCKKSKPLGQPKESTLLVNTMQLTLKKRILIAEDEDFNFQLFEAILADQNIQIVRARNGKEAIQIFENNPDLDLILMDLKMPILTGYEAIEQIRRINTKIPIIAQTAYTSKDDINKAMALGCNSYLIKPIQVDALFEVMQAYF
jgi:CheY-like chemotaxis protein